MADLRTGHVVRSLGNSPCGLLIGEGLCLVVMDGGRGRRAWQGAIMQVGRVHVSVACKFSPIGSLSVLGVVVAQHLHHVGDLVDVAVMLMLVVL